MDRMADIMFSLDPVDYPQLPVFNPITVNVRLPQRVLRQYREFEATMVSEPYDVAAVNSAVLVGKLLQFANGSMYREDGHDVWIHDEKLEALGAIVEEADGASVMVAYGFRFDLERIRRRFKKLVVFGEGDIQKTMRY